MHGRVKVRTSEEEKLRKDKERQAKLKLFKNVMEKVHKKRSQGELDKVLLDFTGQLLLSNADIYTLWNIRREVLMHCSKEKDITEMNQLYDAELLLTEHSLKVNPKSYSAWHQRQWVLTTRSDPDWKKELNLCNAYLKYDERNFHTWDYRRFVVSQCKPPLEDEFNFTTEKIYDNFSNYSAWHHRSKMLVELYPDTKEGRPIEDRHHKEELELVESAAFTDPDDTSAWFYQRWLLGAVKRTLNIVVCSINAPNTTIAFNSNVSRSHVNNTTNLYLNSMKVEGVWESCTRKETDTLWILNHSEDITNSLVVQVVYDNGVTRQEVECKPAGDNAYIGRPTIIFQNQYSKPVMAELEKQLVTCRQLLDLEPDSKWTLLTLSVLLNCINPKDNFKEAIQKLVKLKTIDKLRSGYYDDVISKLMVEDHLTNVISDTKSSMKDYEQKLSFLPHMQYFSHYTEVDLSNHRITSRALPSLVFLRNCKILNLENNQITTLGNFPMLNLQQLSLKGNKNIDVLDLKCMREHCNYEILY